MFQSAPARASRRCGSLASHVERDHVSIRACSCEPAIVCSSSFRLHTNRFNPRLLVRAGDPSILRFRPRYLQFQSAPARASRRSVDPPVPTTVSAVSIRAPARASRRSVDPPVPTTVSAVSIRACSCEPAINSARSTEYTLEVSIRACSCEPGDLSWVTQAIVHSRFNPRLLVRAGDPGKMGIPIGCQEFQSALLVRAGDRHRGRRLHARAVSIRACSCEPAILSM